MSPIFVYESVFNLGYLETISVHPTRHQSFAGKLHMVLRNIWDLVICVLQGWTGKFFSLGGAGQDQKSTGRGRGLNLRGGALRGQGGEHIAYISWLKSYATAKEILIHIALSEFSQIYSTFMILILIIISITIIVIITIIINRTKDDSWDMNGNFISWQVLENKVRSPVCKKKSKEVLHLLLYFNNNPQE